MMTLKEAIKHCEEKACGNDECSKEHKQLAEWLKELQALKANINYKEIEERALEYAKKSGIDHYTDYFDFCQQDYIAGAIEQKAIDEEAQINHNNEAIYKQGYHDAIEKACEWFAYYLMDIGYPDDWMRDSPNMQSGEERFRKAMEE